MRPGLARAALAATVALMALAAYITAIRPLATTIGERAAAIEAARATLERNRALTARLPALERDRTLLRLRIAKLHLHDSPAAIVDRFLHAVARVAERNAVSVQRIAADPRPLPDLTLDVSLRGQYRDVIRAVRRLNAGDVPAAIVLTSIGDAEHRPGARLQLTAAVHVTLLHEATDAAATVVHPL